MPLSRSDGVEDSPHLVRVIGFHKAVDLEYGFINPAAAEQGNHAEDNEKRQADRDNQERHVI